MFLKSFKNGYAFDTTLLYEPDYYLVKHFYLIVYEGYDVVKNYIAFNLYRCAEKYWYLRNGCGKITVYFYN